MNISVIYVAYNTPHELIATSIESVRAAAQAAEVTTEILIVNNGGLIDSSEQNFDARVIGDGTNLGFGQAVNQGVAAASGDYILLMNPDSRTRIDFFTQLINSKIPFTANALTGALLVNNGVPQVHAYNVWFSSIALALKKKRWRAQLAEWITAGQLVSVDRLCGAGLFGPRRLLTELGPFDDAFFLYGEDVDLSLRAKARGASLALIPTAVIEHEAGTSSLKASHLVERARIDAHLRLVSIHRGYLASLLARAESLIVTLAGTALTKSASPRTERLARLAELRRWGLRRSVERFSPTMMAR
ncbi:glycosyltransferase family 2 protein [Zhihengliuella flava]|uniref:GT2 family glycosyltransferase n=1 Tax=Zhihengliuella flava TaxID=1285193 RepID=A0A931D6P5_9MICC|nr:glycosyltransferase family 2 protein [Zhihengliuella flava]MBG6085439.1 GT2 family glycosyltransferase [Zhihengliuella flava]